MPTVIGRSRVKTAELFHALADETRLELLEHLANGERCVCELTDALQTSQSRLSFHLKVLKEAGLIHDRPEGRWVYYAINRETFEELVGLVASLKPLVKSSRTGARC